MRFSILNLCNSGPNQNFFLKILSAMAYGRISEKIESRDKISK